MNEQRFQEILASYGADPRRWPAAERSAAVAWRDGLGASESLREAEALDALLASYAAAPASNDLEIIARLSRKVSAAAPQTLRMGGAGRPARAQSFLARGRNMAAAAGFVAAALTGLVIGFSNGTSGVATTADASDELMVSYAMAEG